MTRRARLLLAVFFSILVSLGLSGAATLLVIGSNGLGSVPRLIQVLVDVAFWPALLTGVPRHLLFYQGLFVNILINAIGYLTIGLLLCAVAELLHPSRAAQR